MQIDDIASVAKGAASHPLTVQVINQGPGIWGNVATGGVTAFAAIVAVMLTHRFTLKREKLALENMLSKERKFITTDLVFLLEQYAEECARVTADYGDGDVEIGYDPTVEDPLLNLTDVSGDWRVLEPILMYRTRELPVLQSEALRMITNVSEDSHYPYYSEYFQERQYQFARLGTKAVILAMRLRKSVGLPKSRLQDTKWSAYNVLWNVWRRERKSRAAKYIKNQKVVCTRVSEK